MTWSVPLFSYVTDLVSKGYLVFGDRVGVRVSLTYLAGCNMLLLLLYVYKSATMYVSKQF